MFVSVVLSEDTFRDMLRDTNNIGFDMKVIWVGSKLEAFTVSSKNSVKISEVRLRSNATKLGLVTSGTNRDTLIPEFRSTAAIPLSFISRIAPSVKLR